MEQSHKKLNGKLREQIKKLEEDAKQILNWEQEIYMQQKIERFRELITEIDISKYKQKAFIKIVNAVFYELFLRPKGVYTVGRKNAKN